MIKMLRIAYWIGIVLDAFAFVQMAFPALGVRMMGSSISPDAAFGFALRLGAGLMLGWTLLLFWADRKPLERSGVIPLTMLVIAWNIGVLGSAIRAGLLPLGTELPRIILLVATFIYYGVCFAATFRRSSAAA